MEKVTVETLQKGQILLVAAKAVNGGKIQLEFAQIVETGNSSGSILAMLNESDERFNVAKPRRAYLSAMPQDIKKYLGIDVADLAEIGDTKELNILDPKMAGKSLNIQITETSKPTGKNADFLVGNFEKTAKRAGKDGDFITTPEGEYIYQILDVVNHTPVHKLITETTRTTAKSDIEKMMANS